MLLCSTKPMDRKGGEVREAARSEAASVEVLRPPVEPAPETNLPAQLTPLIGREREVAAAKEIG
jgi:hypothetical protein